MTDDVPVVPEVEALISRGNAAKALLDNPDFHAVVNDLTNFHLSAMVASPPGEKGKDARDYHHLLQHALTEIVNTLKGYADTGENMLRAVEAKAEDLFSNY